MDGDARGRDIHHPNARPQEWPVEEIDSVGGSTWRPSPDHTPSSGPGASPSGSRRTPTDDHRNHPPPLQTSTTPQEGLSRGRHWPGGRHGRKPTAIVPKANAVPDMTPEEYQARADAAEALRRDMVRGVGARR